MSSIRNRKLYVKRVTICNYQSWRMLNTHHWYQPITLPPAPCVLVRGKHR